MATPDISLAELRNDWETFEPKEFNQQLKDSWVLTEFPNWASPISNLVFLFKKSKKEKLMTKEELKFYNNLPEVVQVFRGLPDSKTKKRGLSWTNNKKTAEWFANRWKTKGRVLSGTINKKDIFAVFLDRNESEIVLNPYRLNGGLKNE